MGSPESLETLSSVYTGFHLALGRATARSGSLPATSRGSGAWKPAQKSVRELKEQDCMVVVVTGCLLLTDLVEAPESRAAGG